MGQALIIILGRTKFITWLPDYTEIFREDKLIRTQKCVGNEKRKKTQIFDIQSHVKEKKKQTLVEKINASDELQNDRLPSALPDERDVENIFDETHNEYFNEINLEDLIRK